MELNKFLTVAEIKARIAELELIAPQEPTDEDDEEGWDAWEELERLRDVESSLSWCWDDSTTLIREDHFEDYCEETCYDFGDCQRNGVVAGFVDWTKVADTLRQDYKVVEVNDATYLVRS